MLIFSGVYKTAVFWCFFLRSYGCILLDGKGTPRFLGKKSEFGQEGRQKQAETFVRPCVQELDSPLIWVRGLLFS